MKSIHGPGLGNDVRKKLPQCLQQKMHSIVPDEKYTGFVESKDNIMIKIILLLISAC